MDLGNIKITAININNERNKYNLTATNDLKKKNDHLYSTVHIN